MAQPKSFNEWLALNSGTTETQKKAYAKSKIIEKLNADSSQTITVQEVTEWKNNVPLEIVASLKVGEYSNYAEKETEKKIANNIITYTASEKLTETTTPGMAGLHTNAFNTTITSHTFSNGTGTIIFADDVTSIGNNAFIYCTSLTSVTIPDSVTSIGNYAFSMVGNVEYHGTATGSPWGALTVNGYIEGDLIFTDSTKTTLTYCKRTATSITIPDSVTIFKNQSVFMNCNELTTIYCLPVTPPGLSLQGMFRYAPKLESIYVPASSVDAYKTARFWSPYADMIKPIQ